MMKKSVEENWGEFGLMQNQAPDTALLVITKSGVVVVQSVRDGGITA